MKHRRFLAILLAMVLSLGCFNLIAGAYDTADFSDVAATHWAYANVMEMADAGIIKGVGDGKFAPADSLTVGSFLALIGRSIYPAECNEAGTSFWWETYYLNAALKGIVKMTEVMGNPADMDREITRNEMARILVRVDEAVSGNVAVTADPSKIPDYAAIPAEFQSFAAQAYAKGLLTGDEHGNFNGGNVLDRAQAATVIQRLITAKESAPDPLVISKTEINMSNDHTEIATYGFISLELSGAVGSVTWTSSDPTVAMVVYPKKKDVSIYPRGSGNCVITAVDEAGRMVTCNVTSTYIPPKHPRQQGKL